MLQFRQAYICSTGFLNDTPELSCAIASRTNKGGLHGCTPKEVWVGNAIMVNGFESNELVYSFFQMMLYWGWFYWVCTIIEAVNGLVHVVWGWLRLKLTSFFFWSMMMMVLSFWSLSGIGRVSWELQWVKEKVMLRRGGLGKLAWCLFWLCGWKDFGWALFFCFIFFLRLWLGLWFVLWLGPCCFFMFLFLLVCYWIPTIPSSF